MRPQPTDKLKQNTMFAWIALGTGMVLLIPLVLQITIGTGVDGQGFNRQPVDFLVMGALIFGLSSLFVVTARKVRKNYRVAVGLAFLLFFLGLWAELAVGIFTNWGS